MSSQPLYFFLLTSFAFSLVCAKYRGCEQSNIMQHRVTWWSNACWIKKWSMMLHQHVESVWLGLSIIESYQTINKLTRELFWVTEVLSRQTGVLFMLTQSAIQML